MKDELGRMKQKIRLHPSSLIIHPYSRSGRPQRVQGERVAAGANIRLQTSLDRGTALQQADDHEDDREDEEHEQQRASDSSAHACNTAGTEHIRDQRDNEENNRKTNK